MSAARRATAADALARMQRAAAAPSPATRTPEGTAEAAEPAHEADTSPVHPTVPAAPSPAPLTTETSPEPGPRPTRTTVDLDRARYVALRAYAAQHAAKGAEVLRALIDQLCRDPELAEIIAERLAHDRNSLTLR